MNWKWGMVIEFGKGNAEVGIEKWIIWNLKH
jgi:hypothetical protein